MVKHIAVLAVLAATALIPARHAGAQVLVIERRPARVYPPGAYYAYPAPAIAYPAPPPMAFPAPPPVALPSPPPAPAAPTCREYRSTATIGGRTQDTFGTACLQPDGSWRLTQ
jgi:hypothetical protein